MATLANISVDLKLDKASFERGIKDAQKTARSFGKSMQRTGRTLTRRVTLPMAAAGAAAVKLATDAEETANKFDVVFGPAAQRSRQELERLTETIPLTITEMERMASGVQDFLVPLGIARNEAADMSTQMVELAGDLASFNNVSADIPLDAIKSGLAGMSRPLRQFGVDISQARLEALALSEGLIEAGEEMDNTARAQAVFLAIQRDSADAMGDAARTVESNANQLRFLVRDVKAAGEAIGRDLIPFVRDLVSGARRMVSGLKEMDDGTRELAVRIGILVGALGPLLTALGTMLTFVTPAGALIGGIGTAAAVLVTLANEAHGASDEAELLAEQLDSVTESAQEMSRAQIAETMSSIASRLASVRAEIAEEASGDLGLQEAIGAGLLGTPLNQLGRALLGSSEAMQDLRSEERLLMQALEDLAETGRQVTQSVEETGDSVQETGEEAQEAAEGVDTLESALSSLDGEFRAIEARARIFGDQINTTVAKADALRSTIISLIRDGFDPQDEALAELIARYEALSDEMIPHAEIVQGVGDDYKTLIQDQQDAAEGTEDLSSEIKSTGQEILAVTSFVLNLAESFGLVGEEAGKAGKVIQGAIGGAGLGASVGGPVGAVVGGVLGGLGGLLGGGPSPAEKLNQEMRVTMTLLSRNAEKLRDVARALGQDTLTAFKKVVTAQQEFAENMEETFSASGVAGITAFEEAMSIDEFQRSMREAGLSLLDLKEAAAELGVPVDELIRVIVTGEGDMNLAAEQLEFFLRAVGMLPDTIDRTVSAIERFARAMDALSFEQQIFDVGLIEEFRERMTQLMNAFGAVFLGPLMDFDLTTVSGVEKAIDALQLIVAQMVDRLSVDFPTRGDFPQLGEPGSGSPDAGRFLPPGAMDFFQDLSEDEQEAFKEALVDLMDVLEQQRQALEQDQDAAGGGGGGGFDRPERDVRPDFVERSVITEIQGSELIALNRSQLVRAEQTVDRLGTLLMLTADLPSNIRDGVDLALSDDLELEAL